ncbi:MULTISPECIES: hypothetical protein [Ectopseudomonas]|jgi:hypothetical protein|uniref:Uncharacterized protein n=2 Tax=Ectopseudomonas TaxID=3236654 RepID=A0A1G6PXC9_9GAMM|nr:MULTISPECIES: hypothetical protein [Pseudomonas]ALN21864.1 hypothetical protein DW68_024615 [Pseudomonas mendocina S5.2]KER98081.1 hypothetical protein HN51_25100 [Pseudomonas mendocina]MBP3061964.1 hypothetical protein [Pseudomonas chengduensis]NNB75257.1 hypothetical protein [Pseudomonas chengduensis]SDC84631.1 hypothetical protein SAMN05216576_107135 [Pseudomonas chengduensis]
MTMMKWNRVAPLVASALFAGAAFADSISVTALDQLSDDGQRVQLQPDGGKCSFHGYLDAPAKLVRIEQKACASADGTVERSPLNATASIKSLPAPAGTRLELAAQFATYQVDAVRVEGGLMLCPPGHNATGNGIEKDGCAGADPVSLERYTEISCPGGRLIGVTPELTKTDPVGVESITLSIAPAVGETCESQAQ